MAKLQPVLYEAIRGGDTPEPNGGKNEDDLDSRPKQKTSFEKDEEEIE
jgi:hypothetical protein